MLYLPTDPSRPPRGHNAGTNCERRGGRGPLPTQHAGRHLTRMFCSAPKMGSWQPGSYRCGLLEGLWIAAEGEWAGRSERAERAEGERRGPFCGRWAVKRALWAMQLGKGSNKNRKQAKPGPGRRKAAASTSYTTDKNNQSRMVQGFPLPAMARRIGMHLEVRSDAVEDSRLEDGTGNTGRAEAPQGIEANRMPLEAVAEWMHGPGGGQSGESKWSWWPGKRAWLCAAASLSTVPSQASNLQPATCNLYESEFSLRRAGEYSIIITASGCRTSTKPGF